ncbi:MAG: hypothetical protein ACKOTB_10475 [Planctomycetia bacterium]
MRARTRDMVIGAGATVVALLVGYGLFGAGRLPRVAAMTAQSDDSFAVCTVPLDAGVEGFFMLDFETGDLSGGVLNPTTSQFSAAYKHNVLKDLGFKPGQVKNPKFLLVSGVAELRRGNATLAPSVLYVTDSSTGTTVAYAIPWNPQPQQAVSPRVALDVARPRGGGGRAK